MANTTTHVLRTSLKARLYREIEIESGKSLYALAEAIVQAFGFDFDHAFGFFSNLTGNVFASPTRYELFADTAESKSVKRTTVAEAFPETGRKMLFLFDYGDEWRFKIEVIGIGKKVANADYPKVLAAVGSAPSQYPDMEDDG